MKKLFTERYGLIQPRVKDNLEAGFARGLLSIIQVRIDEHWFGMAFPDECRDGAQNAGCDKSKLKQALSVYNVIWPEDWLSVADAVPEDAQTFDLIEFCYEHIAYPKVYDFHSYWRHDHFTYDQEAGRSKFLEDINRAFERSGFAFELKDGEIIRIAPTGLDDILAQTVFKTGDPVLDSLLQTAREKILSKSLDLRKEALEKLWDAWERLKTVEPGKDKRAQAKAILDKVSSEPNLRARLEKEALELTEIGNSFMIRHTETTKTPVVLSAHVDYLYHRMFSLIRLLLISSGRGG